MYQATIVCWVWVVWAGKEDRQSANDRKIYFCAKFIFLRSAAHPNRQCRLPQGTKPKLRGDGQVGYNLDSWGCSPALEGLASMYEARGSLSSTGGREGSKPFT